MDARTLDKINTMKGKEQAAKEIEQSRLEIKDQLIGETVETCAAMGLTMDETVTLLRKKWGVGGWIR